MTPARRQPRSGAVRPEGALRAGRQSRAATARANRRATGGTTLRRLGVAARIIAFVLLALVVAVAAVYFVNTPPLWFIVAALIVAQVIWRA